MKKRRDLIADYQSWIFLDIELFILISLQSSQIKESLGSNPDKPRRETEEGSVKIVY